MLSFRKFISEGLDDLHSFAKQSGVKLELDPHFNKNAYHLSWIERSKGEKGSARQVMNKLHDHADKNKKEIHLVAHNSDPKLVNYYKSMGYKDHGESDDGTYMIRKPKKGT